jgi:hypothetical protein
VYSIFIFFLRVDSYICCKSASQLNLLLRAETHNFKSVFVPHFVAVLSVLDETIECKILHKSTLNTRNRTVHSVALSGYIFENSIKQRNFTLQVWFTTEHYFIIRSRVGHDSTYFRVINIQR